RVASDVGDGAPEVLDLLGVADLRREAVVDREPREARPRERLEQRRDVGDLVAGFPAAAVSDDDGGERTFPGGTPRVELQAALRIVDDVLLRRRRIRLVVGTLEAHARGQPL